MEWRRLCFVAYEVEPALLAAELPPSLALDLWRGRAIVSLSLWEARYRKVLGHELANQVVSTEIALRYCVHEGARRGLVTIGEDSSSPAAAFAARALFREPARRAIAHSRFFADDDSLRCEYELEREGRVHRARMCAYAEAHVPEPGTVANFLVHRPYGYARSPQGKLLRYDLEHPPWRVHALRDGELDCDFGALYGPRWAFLAQATPVTVVVADGSIVRASLPE